MNNKSIRAQPLTNQSLNYWKKKGLIPSISDTSYHGRRSKKFIDESLSAGFKPLRLLKFKKIVEKEKKELYHLSMYICDSNTTPLTSDLVMYEDRKVWLPGAGQQLFNFNQECFGQVNVIDSNVALVEILHHSKDNELETQLNIFLKQHPTNVAAWVELGNLQFEAKKYSAAVNCYEAAIKISPLNAELFFNLANCYVGMKQFAVAIQKYKQSINLKPDFAEALYSLSMLYVSLEKSSEAIYLLRWLSSLGNSQWSELATQFIEDIEQQELQL